MTTLARTTRFAERTARMRASTIREMLKVTARPDVISFAGGLPAPELFPTQRIGEIATEVMRDRGAAALQYSVTEGIPELREWVAGWLTERSGQIFSPEDVLIVSGSQQGLDLIGKLFLDPGDHVALERPSYLGAIQAFDAYEARYLSIEIDEHGMLPDALEDALAHANPLPKFVYIVPNFQNPTGRLLADDRREAIVRICERFDVPLIEDDAYAALHFDGIEHPPLISWGSTSPVIYSGTASKLMAPGLRVAWIATKDHDILDKLVLAKQGADLHASSLSQYIFASYVADTAAFTAHIETIRTTYRKRRDAMVSALTREMPDGVSFNCPDGGMFLWCTVDGVDTTELLALASQSDVVFVPGVSFFAHRERTDGMRLNFSNSGEEKIAVGIERLAHAVRTIARATR